MPLAQVWSCLSISPPPPPLGVNPHNNGGGEPVQGWMPSAALLHSQNWVLGPYEAVKTLKDYAESAAKWPLEQQEAPVEQNIGIDRVRSFP